MPGPGAHQQQHAEEVTGEADVRVVAPQRKGEQVGQRVLLRLHGAGFHHTHQVLDVGGHGLEAQGGQRLAVGGAVQRADDQALAVSRCAQRPHGVGDMAKPVVPEGQDPQARGTLDGLAQQLTGRAIQRGQGLCAIGHGERQVEHIQFRHPVAEVARGHVAHMARSSLQRREQFSGPLPSLGDIGYHFHRAIPARSLQPLGQRAQRGGQDGGFSLVAGHGDRGGHGLGAQFAWILASWITLRQRSKSSSMMRLS